MPKISVIMPTYNASEFLKEAIESILAQTFKDFEFIIANEFGSDDGTAEIVNEYAAKDKRIKFIQNSRHLGISATMNYMIDIADGEYIARMDADDISGPHRFETQLKYFQRYPRVGCFGIHFSVIGSVNWRTQYHSDPNIVKAQLLLFAPMKHPTIMRKSDLVNTNRIRYNEGLDGAEDIELYQKMSKYFLLSNIQDKSLFSYRVHAGMTSRVCAERDALIHTKIISQMCQNTLGLTVDDYDAGILSFFLGVKQFDGEDEIKALIRLEELLNIIVEQNNSIKAYEDYAVKFLAYHRWYKELEFMGKKYKNKLPGRLMEIFRCSTFYKLGTK